MVRSNTHLSFSASHFPKLMFYWLFYKFKTWNFEKEIWKRKNWKFERIWFGSCLSAKVKAEICLDFQLREFQLKLRHLNCHNKSAANVSVLLWKQWGGLLVSLVSPQPDSIYDTIVWLVSRENYFMAFQFMFPLCTSTAFLSTLSPCWKFKCSSWPPYWNLSSSPGDCLMESGSHPLSFTFPELCDKGE